MKKSLLTTALLASMSMFAQTKNITAYTLDLERDPFTGQFDTSSLTTIKLDYTGSIENPKFLKEEFETYNYNKEHGRFEQGSRLETKGKVAQNNNDGQFFSDSVFFYFPSKTGTLDWEVYHKVYSTFDAQDRVSLSTSYTNFSYFDYAPIFAIPKGFLLSSRERFFYSDQRQTSIRSQIEGFVEGIEYVSDSIIYIHDQKNRDSLQLTYALDENEELLYLSSKVETKYTDDANWTITTTSYDPQGEISNQSKVENTRDKTSNIEVSKYYDFDGSWSLASIDSTFYEADSISNIMLTYEIPFGEEDFIVTKRSVTSKTLNFLKGNPIPVAPSEFTVINLLNLARATGAQELHPGYTLTWKDESYNEVGFEIYKKIVDNNNQQPVLIHTTAADIETYTDHDVEKGVIYEYFIIAKGAEAASAEGVKYQSLPVSARTDGTTSLNDQLLMEAMVVSPNPIENDQIRVRGINELANYEIYATDGSKIAHGQITDQEPINSSTLDNGMYLLKIQQSNIVKVLKFEKK